MGLTLFNTLSRALEPFVPLDPSGKTVGMYCCGPTVYDYGHIGNFRTFVFGDLVRRVLEFRGYAVRHVMNITDVEDKIIQRVSQTGLGLAEYTRRFEEAFWEDFKLLGCRMPGTMPRATEHIAEMIELIGKLMERGVAYRAEDGSVYFSIEKYRATGARYGQLVNLNFEGMRSGERVRQDEYTKESVGDFALWKARVPGDGNVYWPSPWGEGRPGWHIECSAMSMKHLGRSFDLHLGGEDLMFPHHEDEIAQSEGAGLHAAGCRFVKYWLHGAHLLVEGRKMSKSLGNFYTIRDLRAKGYEGREIRYLLLKAHYRETLNFTMEGLEEARTALGRLDECLSKLQEIGARDASAAPDPQVINTFGSALDEDLNISAAWACLFDWVRQVNREIAAGKLTRERAAGHWATWERLDAVLGLGSHKSAEEAPEDVVALLQSRQEARKTKDFAKADALRDLIKARGWVIEDTPKGPKLKRG